MSAGPLQRLSRRGPFGAVGRLRGRGLPLPAAVTLRTLRRRLLMALAVAVLLCAAYAFWFRDSSFVKVERVEVTGAEGSPALAAALTAAAEKMSTLHVDQDALGAAVADDPSVLSISTDADFPHGLTIAVDTRKPTGWLDADGGTIVAADGVVLDTGTERPDGMPVIADEASSSGERVEGSAVITARVLGAAPKELLSEVDSAVTDPKDGPVVTLNGGIELRFVTPSKADLKWRGAAAVLADADVDAATYIDLSVPDRPVVG